jgi:hypothetical protein
MKGWPGMSIDDLFEPMSPLHWWLALILCSLIVIT